MESTLNFYIDLRAPPLLVNSDVLALHLVKLHPNSRGEGGEELDAFLWCLFVGFTLTRDTIERAFLVRGFPLTPRPPTPHKFGLSLVKLADSLVRICGERGSDCVFCWLRFLKSVPANRQSSQHFLCD